MIIFKVPLFILALIIVWTPKLFGFYRLIKFVFSLPDDTGKIFFEDWVFLWEPIVDETKNGWPKIYWLGWVQRAMLGSAFLYDGEKTYHYDFDTYSFGKKFPGAKQ